MPVASCSCSTVAPARSACCTLRQPLVGRRARRLEQGVAVERATGRRPSGTAPPRRSSERSAFCSASVKLRPMAIASPTDFIVVVSVSSAAGNFSNANRGTLTTT